MVVWGGENLVERLETVLFQASSGAGKIPWAQARHTSLFSGKGFGLVLAIDCLINTIVQSLFYRKDAA